MFYVLSTIVLVLLAFGLFYRNRRNIHIPLMVSAFLIDLGLVLWIELQRQAVEKIVFQEVGAFTVFHALISLCVLLLYGILFYFGLGIVKDRPNARLWHRNLGMVFIGFRLTNYVTSFFV